jgi:hypothetical protein
MVNVPIVQEQSSRMLQNSNIVTSMIEHEADDDEIVDGNNINLPSLSVNNSSGAKTISSPPPNDFFTSPNFVTTTPLNVVSTTTTQSFVPPQIEFSLPQHAYSPFAPFENDSNFSLHSTLSMTEEDVPELIRGT